MSKGKLVLNSAGITQLLLSDEIAEVVLDAANSMQQRCGDGYEAHMGDRYQHRSVAYVEATTSSAVQDNLKNNTLLKAKGAMNG